MACFIPSIDTNRDRSGIPTTSDRDRCPAPTLTCGSTPQCGKSIGYWSGIRPAITVWHDWYQAVPSAYGCKHHRAKHYKRSGTIWLRSAVRTRRPVAKSAYADHDLNHRVADVDELHACERWLSASIEQLIARRESLLSLISPGERTRDDVSGVWNSEYVHRERSRRISELDRVTWELKEMTARATQLRSSRRSAHHLLPIGTANWQPTPG